MNLSKLLLLCSLFFFAYSCSDSKNEVTPPEDISNPEAEKQIEEVIDIISTNTDLTTFKEALAKVDAKKFVENEFTILAYKNKQAVKNSTATISARAVTATAVDNTASQDNEILRHIIGGKYTLDTLKKLKHVVALSKDTLFIKYAETENTLSINGILLGKSMTADKSIIFVTDSIIPLAKDTAVVKEKEYFFKVMKINAHWSPENNLQDSGVAENALVTIYQGDKIIKELKTDKSGEARFTYRENSDLDYIVKTDSSSMLYQGYFVKGLFTSQEQMETAPMQNEFKAIVGGLRFADINGDGIVNSNDKMDRDKLTNLSNDQIIYLVGKSYTFPKNEPDKEDITIDMAYDAYDDTDALFTRFDDKYSTLASRQSLTATSKLVDSLWHNSYEAIRKINIVMEYTSIDKEERLELEGFRANLFFKLSSTFGGIPLQMNNTVENLPRNSIQEVHDAILYSYTKNFDSTPNDRKYKSDEYINTILINRLNKKYSQVSNLTQQAINSGTISLHSNFANSDLEVIRIYLVSAEVNNELGNLPLAIQNVNVLLQAEGKALLDMNTTSDKLRTTIREFYNKGTFYYDRIDEGIKYTNIASWSLNDTWGKYQLLPIPTSALTAFGSETLLIQNPGW